MVLLLNNILALFSSSLVSHPKSITAHIQHPERPLGHSTGCHGPRLAPCGPALLSVQIGGVGEPEIQGKDSFTDEASSPGAVFPCRGGHTSDSRGGARAR